MRSSRRVTAALAFGSCFGGSGTVVLTGSSTCGAGGQHSWVMGNIIGNSIRTTIGIHYPIPY